MVAKASILTVVVMILIAIFELRSAEDAVHACIPCIYLDYIGAGIALYAVRRKRAAVPSA